MARFFIDRPIFAGVISILMVLAGLIADGVTEVHDIYHVDRGYPGFEAQLNALGATVERKVGDEA